MMRMILCPTWALVTWAQPGGNGMEYSKAEKEAATQSLNACGSSWLEGGGEVVGMVGGEAEGELFDDMLMFMLLKSLLLKSNSALEMLGARIRS